jgi:hypothetical protein
MPNPPTPSSKPASKPFDFEAFRRSIEKRDAAAQAALYADDAEMRIVNKDAPPSKPTVLKGRKEIARHISEVCGADMTHKVENEVVGPNRAAFTLACKYPDGTSVMCAAVLHLKDGKIVRQVGVEAWDA